MLGFLLIPVMNLKLRFGLRLLGCIVVGLFSIVEVLVFMISMKDLLIVLSIRTNLRK